MNIFCALGMHKWSEWKVVQGTRKIRIGERIIDEAIILYQKRECLAERCDETEIRRGRLCR